MTSKTEAKFQLGTAFPPKFGLEMRREFMLDFDSTTFCNQGSYGVCPKAVVAYKHAIFDEMESSPDKFFRFTYYEHYARARDAVAGFVGADPANLVFVGNATIGANTVIKNLKLAPEDEILHTDHTYNAVKNTVDATVVRFDADILSLDVKLPILSEDEYVRRVMAIVERNRSVKMAIIDHISSPSAIKFPVEKLVKALHDFGILVLIDGAHAPGQLDLNLEELGKLGLDFYTGNLHKWGYAPRGCAFLWVNPKHQDQIFPLVTSNPYKVPFQELFAYQGTMDYSNYIAAEASVAFYRGLGGRDAILAHVTPLLEWAQDMLVEAFGTEKLQVPKSMEAPFLKLVALPDCPDFPVTFNRAENLIKEMRTEYNVITQVTCFSGKLWTRISCNIYNVKEDYLKLRDAYLHKFKVKK